MAEQKREHFIPELPGSYTGNQAIINSDRILFNARQDSILLYSDKVIGFSTNGSFHFDTSPNKKNSKFIVNSPNIYLGMSNNELPRQCAVKSDNLIKKLQEMIDFMEQIYYDIACNVSYTTVKIGEKTTFTETNFNLLDERKDELQEFKKTFSSIKSRITKLA
tara:strand:- start:1529 stop:2017 length:489 start_codon:yes stop_codon:yes gene_type:complete